MGFQERRQPFCGGNHFAAEQDLSSMASDNEEERTVGKKALLMS
jgi:hypothetical protein